MTADCSCERQGRGGLGVVDLVMIGFGSVIGAGLFVASGLAVRQAGPAVLLGFAVGGIGLTGVLFGLAEMAAADPAPGGLRHYAAKTLGPWMGFTVGWMYWTSGVLTMSSEVTAAALVAHVWLPALPLWALSLFFSVAVTAINFMDVRGYGKVETALSLIKVAALVGFIGVGLSFFVRGADSGLAAIRAGGSDIVKIFPTGLRGLAASMLMVMFSYAGVQTVAMAAPDTVDPPQIVPRGLTLLTLGILGLYLFSFGTLLLIHPWNELTSGVSPFVQALRGIGLTWADSVFSLIILSAALSSLNSNLYSVSRMLFALARDGDAPRVLARQTKGGVPGWALAASSLMLGAAVLLAYLLPHQAYVLVTGASGFISMFNWLVAALCHLRFRRQLLRTNPARLVYRAWGYPYLSFATIAITGAVLLTTPLAPGQLPGLIVGVTQFCLINGIYWLFLRSNRLPASKRGRAAAAKFDREELPGDDRLRLR